MGAAHSADDNRVGSFFVRSTKGVPTSSWDHFLFKLCFDRAAEILTCLGHDMFCSVHSTTHIFFHKETKERVAIHLYVFKRAVWAVCPCKLAVLTSPWESTALFWCESERFKCKAFLLQYASLTFLHSSCTRFPSKWRLNQKVGVHSCSP